MILPIGPRLLEAVQLAYAAGRSVILEGPTGLGKSQLMEEVARSTDGGIGFRCIDLSLLEPPDLVGIPRIDEHQRTTYAIPDFWPETGKGILFFDELNRASTALLNPALQILTTRQIHGHRLPAGWVPMAAMNPASESDYLGTNALDRALLARFSIIQVTADVASWIVWAERNGVHPAVIRYIKADSAAFVGKHSNPRAWVYVSDILHAYDKRKFSLEALLAVASGFVGDLLAFSLLEAYHNPKKVEVPEPSVLIAAYSQSSRDALRAFAQGGDTAKTATFTRKLMLLLQNPDEESAIKNSAKKHANLRKMVADLPAEFRASVYAHSPWINAEPDVA